MRVSSSRLPAFREADDRAEPPRAAEPFRSALRGAHKTERDGSEGRDSSDDTTATTATQAGYLARAAGIGLRVVPAAPREAAPSQPPPSTGHAQRATSHTSVHDASAAAPTAADTDYAAFELVERSGGGGDDEIAIDVDAPSAHAARGGDRTGKAAAASQPADLPAQLGLLLHGLNGSSTAVHDTPIGAPGSSAHPGEPGPARASVLHAAYGRASDASAPASEPITGQAQLDSPVAAWRAAAISRAVASFTTTTGTAPQTPGATGARASDVPRASSVPGTGAASSAASRVIDAGAAAPAPAATDGPGFAVAALTPLEQAVHELVDRLVDQQLGPSAARTERDPRNHDPSDAFAAIAPIAPLGGPAASSPASHETAAAPAAAGHTPVLPEPPANPSHVHLVLEDGPERVVATVAVRGSEVHVALRATDDATAAALARNAASLDHAMRSRGLQLGDLTAEREPRDRRPPQDAEPRERRPRDTARFELEEKS